MFIVEARSDSSDESPYTLKLCKIKKTQGLPPFQFQENDAKGDAHCFEVMADAIKVARKAIDEMHMQNPGVRYDFRVIPKP